MMQLSRAAVRAPFVARPRIGAQLQAAAALRGPAPARFASSYTLTTDDRLEILDLCNKFDHAINLGQQERIGDFFAPDAEVVAPGTTVRGVPAIVAFFQACKPLSAGNRHLTCNVIVEPDGLNAARATAYRLLHRATSPPVLLGSGLIQDRLVNVNGEWRFASRAFLMDPPPSAEAAQQ